tara:strand:- start:1068 stop:1919 length:852 start_codon:yes stop_codon:yes gene_type:complete
MKQLVWFWNALCEDNGRLADEVENLRETFVDRNGIKVTGCSKESFQRYREDLKTDSFMFSYERAAKFYAINRSSFSGATFSGGWSEKAAHTRFTDSSVQRLRDFKAENFRVDYAGFEEAILNHPKAFLYLDPPYLLKTNQNSLYGVNGDLHKTFEHELLHSILSKRDRWVMSYNDCDKIREMYKDYEIIAAEWSYGMKNTLTPAQNQTNREISVIEKKIEALNEKITKTQEFKETAKSQTEELKIELDEHQELLKIKNLEAAAQAEAKKMGKSSEIIIIGNKL